jgi:hypothetical protein
MRFLGGFGWTGQGCRVRGGLGSEALGVLAAMLLGAIAATGTAHAQPFLLEMSRRLDYVAGSTITRATEFLAGTGRWSQTALADPRNACRIKDVADALAQASDVLVVSCGFDETHGRAT